MSEHGNYLSYEGLSVLVEQILKKIPIPDNRTLTVDENGVWSVKVNNIPVIEDDTAVFANTGAYVAGQTFYPVAGYATVDEDTGLVIYAEPT